MERLFQILAVILIGVAAYFLWSGRADSAFIAAVVGSVCFFLSVRFQVKDRMKKRAFEETEKAELNEGSQDWINVADAPAVNGQRSAENSRVLTADGEPLTADSERK